MRITGPERRLIVSKAITTDEAPFYGRTSHLPTLLDAPELVCRSCGSSLRGRRVGRRMFTTGIKEDIYRCPCGTERHERVGGAIG